MKKAILSLFLVLALMAGLVGSCFAASAAEPATVTVTILNAGTVVVPAKSVTVTDRDADGVLTLDEALYAAHEAYYPGGAAKGYRGVPSSYGISLEQFWGDESGAFGYWVNDDACMSLLDAVKTGDRITAFVYADTSGYSDRYAYFESAAYSAVAENAVTVKLFATSYDENWALVRTPEEGAALVVLDSEGKALDDAAYTVKELGGGSYAITVKAAGSYLVMASKATKSGALVPCLTALTVTKALPFTDLAGHWAVKEIAAITEKGLMNGTGSGTFSPNATATRSMIFTMLARLEGVDTTKGETWYSAGMTWAMEQGISDGTNPGGEITREMLATMLYRYAKTKGEGFTGTWVFLLDYPDASEISSWADEAMHWCVMKGILNGKDGSLCPGDTASRAEIAAMFVRFLNRAK